MKDRRHLDRIPSEELTAYERWELPLLDQQGNEVAREEEQDVKPLTAADLEEIRRAAREDGHQEGHEAGYQTGLKKGLAEGRKEGTVAGRITGEETGHTEALAATQKKVSAGLNRLESLMTQLLDPIRQHEAEIETALFNLTTVLARAVIFRELQLDSSHIQAVVKHAMASLPSTRENVKIRVHPEDADWVREVAGRFEVESAVVADDVIIKGGCKIETRHSLVDFTVEKRFQKAVQSILDKQLADDQSGEHSGLDPAMMEDLTDFHDEVLSEPEPEAEPTPEPDAEAPVEAETDKAAEPEQTPEPEPQPGSEAGEDAPEPEPASQSKKEGDDDQPVG
ncbi:MAG: flagellar assembly protein FliH [Oleiphilaceae bacterium]|nr:flagellar assembly protein FliH [Oleiphilaceae bacterium]